MRFPHFFGRSGSAGSSRDHSAIEIKNVRRSGRMQRLGFRKRLRTLLCLGGDEKLVRGGSAEKRRKRGLLSQRLRLASSEEDQSSPLEAVTRLVVRPSVPPAGVSAEQTRAELSNEPSSLTLSSLDENQLNLYLKTMVGRCAAERRNSTDHRSDDSRDGEGLAAPIEAQTTAVDVHSSDPVEMSDQPAARPSLRDCEQLIQRHQELFGPIEGLAEDVWPGSCEPCATVAPTATYLTIPQDLTEAPAELEHTAWRAHFTCGPAGVWRIVKPRTTQTTRTPPPSPDSTAEPAAAARPRRLFGTLRDRCSALFHPAERAEGEATGDAAFNAVTREEMKGKGSERKTDEDMKQGAERTLAESKAEDVLMTIKGDVAICKVEDAGRPILRIPSHDNQAYKGRLFREWRDFFRRREGSDRTLSETSLDPWVTPKYGACIQLASCWWGSSPLVAAALAGLPADAADSVRLAALLDSLRPLCGREPGLARLVARLEEAGGETERLAAWLTRPELPRLFTAAGLGPRDMTRWLLRLDDASEDTAGPQQGQEQELPEQRPDEMAKRVALPAKDADGNMILKQTDMTFFETPATLFAAQWEATKPASKVSGGSYGVQAASFVELASAEGPLIQWDRSFKKTATGDVGRSAGDLEANIPIKETGDFDRVREKRDDFSEASHLIAKDSDVLKETDMSSLETLDTRCAKEWALAFADKQVKDEKPEEQIGMFSTSADSPAGHCSDVSTFLPPEPIEFLSDATPSAEMSLPVDETTKKVTLEVSELSALSVNLPSNVSGQIILKETDATGLAFPDSESALWAAAMKTRLPSQTTGSGDADTPGSACEDVSTFQPSDDVDMDSFCVVEGSVVAPSVCSDYDGTEQTPSRGFVPSELAAEPPASGTDLAHRERPRSDPVALCDSETELGSLLDRCLVESRAIGADSFAAQLRNSSVRPIDSEVDLVQVLHEQSGYAELAGTRPPPTTAPGYQTLPLHEVDSEVDMGLAMPLTDSGTPLDETTHHRADAKTYDSETELGCVLRALHGVDSETEMGERLRRMAPPRSTSEEQEPEEEPDAVDSETEMGVVLRLFEKGNTKSRYYTGEPLPDDIHEELTRERSFDSDVQLCTCPMYRGYPREWVGLPRVDPYWEGESESEYEEEVEEEEEEEECNRWPSLSSEEVLHVAREMTKWVLVTAIEQFWGTEPPPPLRRKESLLYDMTFQEAGVHIRRKRSTDDIEVEGRLGLCTPEFLKPAIYLTTPERARLRLEPSHNIWGYNPDKLFFETEERMMIKLRPPSPDRSRKRKGCPCLGRRSPTLYISPPPSPVPELVWPPPPRGADGGPTTTETSGSTEPAAAAAPENQPAESRGWLAPSAPPAAAAAAAAEAGEEEQEEGVRVLYRAGGVGGGEDGAGWQPLSPEGMSAVALEQVDPELAAIRWRRSSRAEDGEPDPAAGEAAPPTPPPAHTQSEEELRKQKTPPPETPPPAASSW